MSTFAEYTKKQKKKSVENTSFREYTKSVLGDSFEDDIAPVKSGGGKTETKKKDKKKSLLGDIELVKDDTIFDDGYQFGDVTKSTLANLGKFTTGVAKGALAPVEGISDLLLHGAAGVSRFVGADGLAESLKKEANINSTQGMFAPVDKYLDKYSTMGRTLESANEGFGQVASLVGGGAALKAAGLGTNAIATTTQTLLGASAAGSGISEAYQGGANDKEALKHGLNTGISAVMTEMLFGGLGKSVNAFGIGKGLSSADDILAQKLTGKINNVVARNAGQFAIKSGAEGVEEILDGVANAVSKKMTYMSEEDIEDIMADENLLESFVVGTLSSAAMQSGVVPGTKSGSLIEANKNKTDFITGYTNNEQKVIDKVVEERIAEKETDGKKLSAKEKANIEEAVKKDLEKGYIDTDTIESVLGGETYEGYKSLSDKEKTLQEEIKTLENDPRASAQTRLAEAKAELDKIEKGTEKTELKERLSSEVRNLAMSDRLLESYNEKSRKTQKFAADLSQYDEKAQMTVKKAVESGILNNTNRTHDFVDMVAKLSADKGVLFDFTNNENLKKSGFAIEGKTINGLVKDNDIILNIDSKKALNTVVGHEIAHVLEGTDLYSELQNAVKEYATIKGDYDARLHEISALYKDVDGANIKAELTADLIGDYLFTDSDFISKLSTEKPNVFKKIFDEIKYLVKIATAGSKEARELEKVKRAFENAYKESGKNNSETKYSVSDSNIKISVNDYHSGEMFATMTYEKDGKVVGTLDYSEYEGKPNVKMIEVTPEYRRNGIGKKLLQELQRQYPDVEIDYGMTTPDGTKLLDAITYTQTDEQVAKGKQKLSDLQTELENVENRLNELYEIDELTAEQQEEMEQLGERWDELYYTEIPKLTEEYGDKSASKRFVKMDDVKYSLTKADKTYLDAVEKNDTETTQKMVDKAAKKAGYSVKAYHGTPIKGLTVFDHAKIGSTTDDGLFGHGFYFTTNKLTADGYATVDGETMPVFLRIEKPWWGLGHTINEVAEELGLSQEILTTRKVGMNASVVAPLTNYSRTFTSHLVENGYDSVVVQHGRNDYEVVVFDNAKIKSADAVTYDDNGNVIPLSERFNQKKEDIRYSLTDSDGKQLSPAIQNRFANSKAVDENGNLKVLYHGTASGEFAIFDKSKGSVEGDFGSGFYFTDNEADVSEHYEGGGPDFENKVARRAEQLEWEEELDYSEAEARAREELFKGGHKFEVYLNIEKPAIVGETILFDPDEYYSQYDQEDYDSEEDYEGDVEQLVADDIDNIIWDIERNVDVNSTDGIAEILWNALNEGGIDVESLKAQVNELYLEDSNGNMVGNEVARQIIESLGYDGIIDPTVSGKWNMDMEAGTTHYIVFKPNQIKAVSNENPTDNPDINLSLSKKGNIAPVGDYNVYGKDIRLEQSAPVEELPIAPIEEQQSKEHFSLDGAEDTVESEEDGHIAGEDLTKKNAERIKVIQSEVKGYRLTKDVTNKEFADKIAKKEAEYEALQRKDTKKAMDLRNQITRLEARRDSLIKSLDGKIERANKRIESIENESRYVKRKSKQNQYRELFGRIMGDTSTWVDKKLGIQYQTNTLRRNLRDIVRDAGGERDIARADAIYDELQGSVNRNEAKKNREANSLKNMFREMKINNTESTYIQMLGELRHNPDTTLTQDAVNEFYKKNKSKIDTKKVDNAIEEARKLYDSLYDRVNAALSEHGFKEMGYRKGYFPHFTDPKQNWLAKLLNWKVQNDEIPTDIAGLTELFEPQRTWQSFDKHRMSDSTDYNFLKGLDNYVNGALDWIYHIEDIQKHRAFETEIRYRHSSEAVQKKIDEYRNNPMLSTEEVESLIQNVLREAKNPLNNFVTDLHTRTNILAGKKSSKDRNMESDFNRHAYSVMTNVTNRVTANQVVGSISSAMTNFIPITQSWGQVNPTSSLVGMKKTIQSYMKDDGVIAKSDFLTNRLAMNEALYKDAWDKIGDKVGCLMEIADNFTSQTVWRSKYYENIKNGMAEAQAIKDADQFAENVIGGRSKGNQPTIFHAKNPVTKMLTSFQLEVSNQYGYMFKDMPQDIGKNALGKLTKGYATMFVGAYAYNALYSTLTGRDAAFDPIRIIEEFIGDLSGDDDEEENVADAIAGLASNVADEIPFVGGLLGGGRIPISSALPYNASISDAYADVVAGDWKSVMDEMSKPLYYGVMPMGGGQIRKTVQGLSMFDDDHPVSGSYTKSGNLRYPVEDTIANRFQAALFGQYSSSTAREYFDREEAPLKEKQIQEYADLDMPIREYWDYRKGLKKQETLEDKFEYIADLDVSVEQKNIMINNIVDRKEKVDMSNYDDFANYEEFDFYVKNTEKYNFLQEYDVTYNEYKANKDSKEKYDSIYNWYKNNPEKVTLSRAVTDDVIKYREYTSDLNDIRADKDADGKTISGSAKAKKIEYINNLDLDYGQRLILYRSIFDGEKDKEAYNGEILEYLNSREDLSYEDIVTILEELDFKVYEDGTVEW